MYTLYKLYIYIYIVGGIIYMYKNVNQCIIQSKNRYKFYTYRREV